MPRYQVEVGGSAIIEADSKEEALAAFMHEMEDIDIHPQRILGTEEE